MHDENLEQEVRKALAKFSVGVQFAVTLSCGALGASLGVAIANNSRPLLSAALALIIGGIAAATASYVMFRAEARQLREAEKPQYPDSDD